MKFSVLIPVYNVEKYICECVESVLKQNFSGFEIVLVDDGSTDSSGKICDEFASEFPDKIRVIHKSNEGLLIARRTGIKNAKGDYFVFLDSDDYMLEGSLDKLNVTIDKYDCDMILYNYYKEQEEMVIHLFPDLKRCIFQGSDKNSIYTRVLVGAYLNAMCTRAVKREIVDIDTDYYPYQSIGMGEDLLQGLPLYTNAKKIVYIDETLIFYRKNQNSFTAKWKADYFYSFQKIQKVLNDYIVIWGIDEETVRKFHLKTVSTVCDYLGFAFKEGKTKFKEISHVVFSDDYLMTVIDEYGSTCPQLKHRIYSRLLKRRNIFLLREFTSFVLFVIRVKETRKKGNLL